MWRCVELLLRETMDDHERREGIYAERVGKTAECTWRNGWMSWDRLIYMYVYQSERE
jgi:hypothetical protein